MRTVTQFLNWLKQPDHAFIALVSLFPFAVVLMYATTNALPYPYRDAWKTFPVFDNFDESAVNVAIKTANGTLTIDDLFFQHNSHRIFFVKLTTMISTLTTGWRTELGVLVTIGAAAITVLLLARLLCRHIARAAVLIVPVSLLVFSMHQRQVWTWEFLSSFHMVITFFVAALGVLYLQAIRWRALIASLLLLVGATFTMAGGLVGWPALLIGLWLRGYRRWRYYGAFLAVMIVTIGLYFTSYDFAARPPLDLPITERVMFVVRTFGSVFVPRYSPYTHSAPPFIGMFGIALVVIDGVFLQFRSRNARQVAPWLTLAFYSFGILALMSLGGRVFYNAPRYVPLATPAWIVLIVLAFLVIRHVYQSTHRTILDDGLMYANILALVALVALYTWANTDPISNRSDRIADNAHCVRNYPIDLNHKCIGSIIDGRERRFYERIGDLSRLRLSVYRDLPELSLLQDYTPDSPVIIEAERAWQHFHILDRWPADRRPDNVLHLLSPQQPDDASEILGETARHVAVADRAAREAAVQDFIGEADDIWYLFVNQERSVEPWLNRHLGITRRQAAYDVPDIPFTIVAYTKLHDQYYVDSHISLQSWTLHDDVRVEACQEITLDTTWATARQLPENYSLTLVLANNDGMGVARADGNPSPVLTKQWRPGWVYTDERSLTVPCDIAPGDYALLIGLYDYETLEPLPVTTTDGAPLGDQLYLTTLTVAS